MQNVLLLGSNGMLGQAVRKQLLADGYNLKCVDKWEADYCFDLLNDIRLKKCIEEVNPDIIINSAALVSLEQCEGSPGDAYCINARLPGILAGLCEKDNRYLIHISTDHYFIGDKDKKHNEEERVRIVNEYARTKYIGEQLALSYEHTLVIRTNIVGFRGVGHPTFIEWAMNEIENDNEMKLFTDFYTSSIHTVDLAKILVDIMDCRAEGMYNIASSDVTNKKQFILHLSDAIYGHKPRYKDASVKKLSGAPRAESLGLDCLKTEKLLGYSMPTLEDTIESITREYRKRKR